MSPKAALHLSNSRWKQGLDYEDLCCRERNIVWRRSDIFTLTSLTGFYTAFSKDMPNVISSITTSVCCWGPMMSDWNSRGSCQLKFCCISFTWVATKPWSIAINPVKKIKRIPVVFCGEGHNLNLKEKDALIKMTHKRKKANKLSFLTWKRMARCLIIRLCI